jgi:hypothetical protein
MKPSAIPVKNILFTLFPFLVLCILLLRYSVDVPVSDEWTLLPFLQKAYESHLTLFDFWSQQSEHRFFFPRLIMVPLALTNGWNTRAEMFVSVILGIGILVSLALQIRRTLHGKSGQFLWSILPVVSCLVFGLNQSENWFWGWQMSVFLSVFGAVAGFYFLADPDFSWKKYFFGFACGVIATYSYSTGVCFWPASLLILILLRRNKTACMLWVLGAIGVAASYLYHYEKPSGHPSVLFGVVHPFQYLGYVFSNLAAPLVAFIRKLSSIAAIAFPDSSIVSFTAMIQLLIPVVFGIASCTLAWVLVRLVIRKGILTTASASPYIGLMAYSFFAALLIAVGRGGFGISSALVLRYVTASSLFWIAILFFLFLLRTEDRMLKWPSWCIVIILSFLMMNSVYGALYAIKQSKVLTEARKELMVGKDDALLARLYYPSVLHQYIPLLKKYHLSVYRN